MDATALYVESFVLRALEQRDDEDPRPTTKEGRRTSDGAEAERELMERVQRGDRDAFARLYRRHERRIFNYLVRLAGNRALAEDLLQDTFTRVWLGARTWDAARGSLRAWIYRIALNVARSELRRLRHKVTHVAVEGYASEIERAAGREPSLVSRIDRRAQAEAVRVALQALPDYLSDVVVLRCQEQLSFAEIASVTGAPVGTLKARFHRAVVALRRDLGAAGGAP